MMAMQWVAALQGPSEIELQQRYLPALGPRDIRVKVEACGICGTDMDFLRRAPIPKGSVLGHEFAGRVIERGDEAEGVALGDLIVPNPLFNGIGLGRADGGFAQFVRVPDVELGRNVHVLPPQMAAQTAALVEPFSVGLHAANIAKAQPGDKVVIFGAGTIGLCVLAALRARGVEHIVIVDMSRKRLEVAQALGARWTHDLRDGPVGEAVRRAHGEEATRFSPTPFGTADLVFDCAGAGTVLDDGVRSLRKGGRFVIVAEHHKPEPVNLSIVVGRELSIIGTVGYADEFADAIELLSSGRVDLSPLVTHRFALADVNDALRAQLDGETAIKILIVGED